MKIICWNVNGIRACFKKGLPDFIEKEKPDVFCVQESKAWQDQVDQDILSLKGMKSHWAQAKRKGYSGVTTFLNEELEIQVGIGVERFDDEGRVIISRHKDFDLYNIYFPNGASGAERQAYKMDFLKTLKGHLGEKLKSGREVIVLGDFNIAHRDIDIFDPQRFAKTSGFLPEERAWLSEFIDMGFVDSFRKFHPEVKERYSWWNQIERARVGNRGWRIDMICVSKGLEKKLVSADILHDVEGSDHCPIKLEISSGASL